MWHWINFKVFFFYLSSIVRSTRAVCILTFFVCRTVSLVWCIMKLHKSFGKQKANKSPNLFIWNPTYIKKWQFSYLLWETVGLESLLFKDTILWLDGHHERMCWYSCHLNFKQPLQWEQLKNLITWISILPLLCT